MDSLLKVNSFKLGPNHYEPKRQSVFSSDKNSIHFAYNKAERRTYFAEAARTSSWVPGPNAYKTEAKKKIKGTQK